MVLGLLQPSSGTVLFDGQDISGAVSLDRRETLAFRLAGMVRRAGGWLSIGADIDLAAEVDTGAVHVREIADIARARQTLGSAGLIGLWTLAMTPIIISLVAAQVTRSAVTTKSETPSPVT